jgi:hypothetical protein
MRSFKIREQGLKIAPKHSHQTRMSLIHHPDKNTVPKSCMITSSLPTIRKTWAFASSPTSRHRYNGDIWVSVVLQKQMTRSKLVSMATCAESSPEEHGTCDGSANAACHLHSETTYNELHVRWTSMEFKKNAHKVLIVTLHKAMCHGHHNWTNTVYCSAKTGKTIDSPNMPVLTDM